jgi:hypothetical protein
MMFEKINKWEFPIIYSLGDVECDGLIVHETALLGDPEAHTQNDQDDKPGQYVRDPPLQNYSAVFWLPVSCYADQSFQLRNLDFFNVVDAQSFYGYC